MTERHVFLCLHTLAKISTRAPIGNPRRLHYNHKPTQPLLHRLPIISNIFPIHHHFLIRQLHHHRPIPSKQQIKSFLSPRAHSPIIYFQISVPLTFLSVPLPLEYIICIGFGCLLLHLLIALVSEASCIKSFTN